MLLSWYCGSTRTNQPSQFERATTNIDIPAYLARGMVVGWPMFHPHTLNELQFAGGLVGMPPLLSERFHSAAYVD